MGLFEPVYDILVLIAYRLSLNMHSIRGPVIDQKNAWLIIFRYTFEHEMVHLDPSTSNARKKQDRNAFEICFCL